MTTALIRYQRYEVEDPLLDCAIMILNQHEYWEQERLDKLELQEQSREDDEVAMHFYWGLSEENRDYWMLWQSLERARDHCKEPGRKGYIWVDRGWLLAYELLDACASAAFSRYRLQRAIKEVRR